MGRFLSESRGAGVVTLFSILALLFALEAHSENFPITLRVRAASTVMGSVVTVGDIGIVESSSEINDEKAVALKRVILIPHLRPGQESDISAYQLLEQLRGAAFEPGSIGYAIPERVTIKRAGRDIGQSELQNVLDEYLHGSGREARVKSFSHDGNGRLFVGPASMRVLSVERQRVGLSRIIVEARSESGEVEQLTLVGTLDEFMYMPVASRQLSVGNVVSYEDVVMARLDTKSLPRDVASTRDGIVGHAVKRTLSAGDFFRSPDLVLPPDMTAGSSVTIRFSGRGFTATATGSALEGGRRGGKIRVRNDISKRILQGTIVEPGLVEVQ